MLRVVDGPRTCSYLPIERASLEVLLDWNLTADQYGKFLRRGYRRFGWQIFRPACRQCNACISLRVLVDEFKLSASGRRVMRLNRDIRCELAPASVTDEHVALYNRYQAFMHNQRGWALQTHSRSSYSASFVSGPKDVGWEWRYFQGDQLVGVSLMDKAPGAISLVYFYYDPAWRNRSPGRFSILNQLLYAKERALQYAYLGYWVEACPSLNYKSRYVPHEALQTYVDPLTEPVWRRMPVSD